MMDDTLRTLTAARWLSSRLLTHERPREVMSDRQLCTPGLQNDITRATSRAAEATTVSPERTPRGLGSYSRVYHEHHHKCISSPKKAKVNTSSLWSDKNRPHNLLPSKLGSQRRVSLSLNKCDEEEWPSKRSNLPVKRLSLNRSQYESCSARYDTSTES